MALLKCSECGHDVSDQAPSCPNCGVLINKQSNATNVDLNFKNYELTSKKWKKHYAWGIPLLIIGFPLFFFNLMLGASGTGAGSPGWFFIGLIFCLVGGINTLIAVIGSWWERG